MKLHLLLPVLRAQRHLTQLQVAQLAGLRPDTISALEREKTTGIQFETLARLCEVLRCQPGDLFVLEQEEHEVPWLGGPDEDALLEARLAAHAASPRLIDGPSFVAELNRLYGHEGGERKDDRAGHDAEDVPTDAEPAEEHPLVGAQG